MPRSTECKPGYVKNPASGRCVAADGPTGRKLRGLKPLPKFGPKPAPKAKPQKACAVGKVRNPRTGRCNNAVTLCHKMNGINPAKFGNATAAACRNALIHATGIDHRRTPFTFAHANRKGDPRLTVIKEAAGVVQTIALAALARQHRNNHNGMMLTSGEQARLRSIGFRIKHDYKLGTTGTLSKHGVTIKLHADDQLVVIEVGRKGSKKSDVAAVWAHNNLEVDILQRTSAWPEATAVLRATLKRRIQ